MSKKRVRNGVPLSLVLVLSTWATASLDGSVLSLGDPSENFANFGKQPNFCIAGGGVCFAASAINSFIFLENQYPTIYDRKLTPNVVGVAPTQTDPTDTTNFANAILASFPSGLPNSLSGWNAYLTEKMTWINSAAPGTTVFDSFYVGSANNSHAPTSSDLSSEIQAQEDVEMFISGGGIAHAIVLTGISCSSPTSCTMTYQDPNSPTVEQTAQLTAAAGGLQFVGLPGTDPTLANTTFTINAAFSESPVPEPSSGILFGIGSTLLGYGYWAKRKFL